MKLNMLYYGMKFSVLRTESEISLLEIWKFDARLTSMSMLDSKTAMMCLNSLGALRAPVFNH